MHGGASYAIVGGTNQQQQQQLSNLQANSSHLQNGNMIPHIDVNISHMSLLSAHNNTSSNAAVGSITNVVQQGANTVNVNSLAANATNCISPNSMAGLQQVLNAQQQQQVMGVNANNATRASPGLLSPKHMNGE